MNAESAQQPQADGGAQPPGVQLKARREALGWSVEHVAEQLKLAPRQVSAIEDGDAAALPNLAVVRGFIRAYAKVVKLDAAPLVAMIEVNPVVSEDAAVAPARREISASFSADRFPSLTQRSSRRTGWIAGAVALVALAAFGAYQTGLISPALLAHTERAATRASVPPAGAAAAGVATPGVATPGVAPVETTLIKPGQEVAPLQSPTVPLVSVPVEGGSAPATPGTLAPAGAPVVAPAPVANNALVLNVRKDTWVEIRRVGGGAPLISRVVVAGSTETFDITEPALLIVGKPEVVAATLRGAPLELTAVPGKTLARVSIK